MIVDKVLFDNAQQVVKENKNFSPSFLQRKLAIGYNHARWIIKIIKAPYQRRLEFKNNQRVKLFSKRRKSFR